LFVAKVPIIFRKLQANIDINQIWNVILNHPSIL
jgi:hypothetical protein